MLDRTLRRVLALLPRALAHPQERMLRVTAVVVGGWLPLRITARTRRGKKLRRLHRGIRI